MFTGITGIKIGENTKQMTLKFKEYEPEKNGLMIHVSSVNINNISDLEYFVGIMVLTLLLFKFQVLKFKKVEGGGTKIFDFGGWSKLEEKAKSFF